MIYLTNGQTLYDNGGLVVYDPTGYYNDGDSVICAYVDKPDEPFCRYEAKYIAYGGIVYSISDPDQLQAQIDQIDPANLFGKDSTQVATDNMVQQIQTVNTAGSSASTSTPSTSVDNSQASTINNPPVQQPTPTDTATPAPSPISTATPDSVMATPTPTDTPTPTPTPTPSPTPTLTPTPALTPTPDSTSTSDSILPTPTPDTSASGTPLSIVKKRKRSIA